MDIVDSMLATYGGQRGMYTVHSVGERVDKVWRTGKIGVACVGL